MKKDIFQVFGIEKKEDKYTFALCEFFRDPNFRTRAAGFFGFHDGTYQCSRETILLDTKTEKRTKITPDIILHDSRGVAVIESKMFSGEGWMQTMDYESAQKCILQHFYCDDRPRDVRYYYFTLSASRAANQNFETLSWADFYVVTLSDMDFKDTVRNCLRDAILTQACAYQKAAEKISVLPYSQLFSESTYWVSPFSLFVSNSRVDLWSLDEDYAIVSHVVTGNGHSEFTTDLKKTTWVKQGKELLDNAHLFIRWEWKPHSIGIYLNWENFNPKYHCHNGIVYDYVATKQLGEGLRKQTVQNKHRYLDAWDKWYKDCAPEGIDHPSKTEAILRMLKYELDCTGLTVREVLEQAKPVIDYYESQISLLVAHLGQEDEWLTLCNSMGETVSH